MDSNSEPVDSPWRHAPDGFAAGADWTPPDVDIVRGGTGENMRYPHMNDLDAPFLDIGPGTRAQTDTGAPDSGSETTIVRHGTESVGHAAGAAFTGDAVYEVPITRSETSSRGHGPDGRQAALPAGTPTMPQEAPHHIRGDIRADRDGAAAAADSEVVQGVIVEEGYDTPAHPFDAVLSVQNKVTLIGDKAGVAKAVFETVNTHAERAAETEKPVVIIAARFDPSAPSHLVDAASPDLYTAVSAKITDEKGLFGALSGGQKATVIADAASRGDPNAGDAYEQVLTSVIAKIEAKTGAPATLPLIRDGIREIRDARAGVKGTIETDMPTMGYNEGRDLRKAVGEAIWDPNKETNRATYEALGHWLDKVVKDIPDETAAPQTPGPESNGYRPNVTVIDVEVGGHRRGLKAQSDLAANAILALVAEKDPDKATPWGQIGGLAMIGADLADPEAVQEIFKHTRGRIPTITTVERLDDNTVPIARESDMYGVVMPAGQDDVAALSAMLPTILRDDVTGESHSRHANAGRSRNNSVNFGYEENSESEKSGGRTHSQDKSKGETYDASQSRTIGEGSVLLPRDINGSVRPGEIGLVQRDGTTRGVYEIDGRGFIADRPFPPPQPEKMDVNDKIDGILGEGQHTAIGSGSDRDPSFDSLAERKLPFSLRHELDKLTQRDLGQPWQEKRNYEVLFNRDQEAAGRMNRGSVRGLAGPIIKRTSFEKWLRQRYALEHRLAEQKYEEIVEGEQLERGTPLDPQEKAKIWHTIAVGGDNDRRIGRLSWSTRDEYERDLAAWRSRRGH